MQLKVVLKTIYRKRFNHLLAISTRFSDTSNYKIPEDQSVQIVALTFLLDVLYKSRLWDALSKIVLPILLIWLRSRCLNNLCLSLFS